MGGGLHLDLDLGADLRSSQDVRGVRMEGGDREEGG